MTYPPPPPQSPAYGSPAPSGGKTRLRGRVPRLLGWISLAVAIVLIVVGAVIVGTKSLGKVDDFQRVKIADGSGTVNLDGTGKWVIYYEADNVSDSIKRIPDFTVAVTAPSGAPVSISPYGKRTDGKVDKFTYDYHGHKGAAAGQFTVDQKGSYRVTLQGGSDLPSDATAAFGRDIKGSTLTGGVFVLIGVLFIVAAIVLLIVGFVKRSRHKKEISSGGYGGYGGPPPGYGQAYPAGGYPGGGYPAAGYPGGGYGQPSPGQPSQGQPGQGQPGQGQPGQGQPGQGQPGQGQPGQGQPGGGGPDQPGFGQPPQ